MKQTVNILIFFLSFIIIFSAGISYAAYPGECAFLLEVRPEIQGSYGSSSYNRAHLTFTRSTGEWSTYIELTNVYYWDRLIEVYYYENGVWNYYNSNSTVTSNSFKGDGSVLPENCNYKCEVKTGEFYNFVRYPGILNITKDCIDGCEVSIQSGESSQSLTVFKREDDGNYWTYGDAYYTGQACQLGQQSEVPPDDEVPTCPEYLSKCDASCMGASNVTFKSCEQGGERLCTCNGQAPPHIDLGDEGWKPDSDHDGVPNQSDPDIDGDGKSNGNDDDTDGDGIPNVNDSDVDNDGVSNGGISGWGASAGTSNGVGSDPNVDGDEHDNRSDTDVDGDGNSNGNDSDVDGDGVKNNIDNDVDGDGYLNWEDSDIDGDGLPNDMDADPYGNAVVNGDTNEDGTVDGTDENTGDNGTEGSEGTVVSTEGSQSGGTEEGEEGEEPTGSNVPFGYTASGSLETEERINFDNIKTGVEQLKETGPFQLIEQITELKDVLITAPEVPEFRIEITPSDFIFGHHYINVSLESWEPVLEIMRFFLGIYFLVLCFHFNIRQWNS